MVTESDKKKMVRKENKLLCLQQQKLLTYSRSFLTRTEMSKGDEGIGREVR